MELLWYELKKCIRTREFLVMWLLTVLSIAGFVVPLLTAESGERFLPAQYKKAVQEIAAQDISADELRDAYDRMLFDREFPETRYTDDEVSEMFLYEALIREKRQIEGYHDYILQAVQEQEHSAYLALFSEEDSSAANREKTREDFAPFTEVYPPFAAVHGINVLTEYPYSGFAFLMLALFLAAILVCDERERFTGKLVDGTRFGDTAEIRRYCAGILLLIVFFAVEMSVRLALTAYTYGLDVLSLPIQSVYGYQSCVLPITIGRALGLILLGKLGAVLGFYALVYSLAMLLEKKSYVFLVTGVWVGVSVLLYRFVNVNDRLGVLRYFNLFSFLDAEVLLKTYRNFSLFGRLFSYQALAAALLLGVLAAVLSFVLLGGRMRRHRFGTVISKVTLPALPAGKSLFAQELYKWLIHEKGVVVLVLFAALLYFNYKPINEILYTDQAIYYKYYVQQQEGIYTGEKLLALETEAETLTDMKRAEGLEQAIRYAEYLKEKPGAWFLYPNGHEAVLGLGQFALDALRYQIIALLMMIVAAGLMIDLEYRSGMERFLRLSAVGVERVRRVKRMQLFLLALMLEGVVFGIRYAGISNYFHLFPAAPAYSLERFGALPGWVKLGGVFLVLFLVQTVFLYLIGVITHALYRRSRQLMVSYALALGAGAALLLMVYGMAR